MIAEHLAALEYFRVPPSGDCSGLLRTPGAVRFKDLAVDGQYPVASAIADAEADLAETVAPCEVCGHDTYLDITVGWVRLAVGDTLINGYRLCDSCARQASAEEYERGDNPSPPFIDKLVLIHRTNDHHVTATADQWRALVATHCGVLNLES